MKFSILALFLICLSCKSSDRYFDTIHVAEPLSKTIELTEAIKKSWHHLDYKNDTIPGISSKKAYAEILKKLKGEKIVVAVIDMTVDLEHKDLKSFFWVNDQEVPDNKIDDDRNGFVDDIHGWNFMGNSAGGNVLYENFEFVRVLRHYQDSINKPHRLSSRGQNEYQLAKKLHDSLLLEKEESVKSYSEYLENYSQSIAKIAPFIKIKELTLSKLDSLESTNDSLSDEIYYLKWAVEYGYDLNSIKEEIEVDQRYLEYYYNLEYEERKITGDNSNNLSDSNYGNNDVSYSKDKIDHGTIVAGLIVANRGNNIGIKGISNNVEIMPIVAAVSGQAHDKDIALAIRYAVDNGAKIINISIIKQFSIHKEWILDAIKYASEKDVLIINGAGNDNMNLDLAKNFYPNDTDYEHPEVSDNFIMVGGNNYTIDKNLKYYNSNYGKENVDVFAPAQEIYAPVSLNKYEFVTGTSMAAPIVSGVAALIRSYYPNLNASEVKTIIMESGTLYDISVNVSSDFENEVLVPFSSLSKSGKIVNAYNALLMAEKVSKKKK